MGKGCRHHVGQYINAAKHFWFTEKRLDFYDIGEGHIKSLYCINSREPFAYKGFFY